jgi:hypothetical protein
MTNDDAVPDAAACRLPPADRTQRTADFRALFANTLIGRARVADGVRWILRARAGVETESHRLASLESRCCDGIRFLVVRDADHIVWRISGPPSAKAALDAFYALPALVLSDDGAAQLWATLDRAGCGSTGPA